MAKMFKQLDELKEHGFKVKHWSNYGFAVLFPSDGKVISFSEALKISMRLIHDYRDRDDLLFSTLTVKNPDGIAVFVYFKNPIIQEASRISQPYGLEAEILEDIFSVGVGGDEGTYTPVVNLIGPFPGHEILEKVSIEIGNTLPINRITFQLAVRK